VSYVARCEQCGVIETGDFETVGDALEGHEEFHDVDIERAATDGGSKYVNETGEGYLGIVRLGGYSLNISIGAWTNYDWRKGDDLWVVDDGPGLSIVDEEPDDPLGQARAFKYNVGAGVKVSARLVRQTLDIPPSVDVRIYRRDDGGMRVVPAHPDPMLATDGGVNPETEWRLECMDCDYDDTISGMEHPAEGPPDAVEHAVRLHKNMADESHVVRVKGVHNPEDRDIDPSLLTDGEGSYDITLERTHVRDGDKSKQVWKVEVDNADAYTVMGGRTPGRALRALAREFDDTFGSEPRTDGGPTLDEADHCASCGQTSDETNLGYSEAREDFVCAQCVAFLGRKGYYPDEEETNTDETGAPVKNLRIAVDGDHLDVENPLHYLVALAVEARRYDGSWEDDEKAAQWVIAHWCQEIGWAPDLRDYGPGEIVDKTDDIQHCDAVFYDRVADGGRDRGRLRHQSVDAVRSDAGVGDQDPTCENGNRGCGTPLPCFECLMEEMDDE
jgi:hypothetical protein